MADLYLLPSEQTQAVSKDELRSVVTSAGNDAKGRVSDLLSSLSAENLTPARTLETTRELASAVSQELRDQKLKPHEFKAVLNDVPPHARGALEDALKSVNVAPVYLAENAKNGYDVVNPVTDRAMKRANPASGAEQEAASTKEAPLDLRHPEASGGRTPERGAWSLESTEKLVQANLGPDIEQVRNADELRNRMNAVATAAKEAFDKNGTPESARQAVIDVPAHLTGAMESALARQGITAVHVQERDGTLLEGATLHSGAEQRGLKAVRDAFGAEGKGVSDNQIRQALGSERLQDLGRDPKVLSTEVVEKTLASRPETINESNRRVNAVLEAAQSVSRPPLAVAREALEAPDAMGPHKPVLNRAELKELEPEPRVQRSEPASISTLDRGGEKGEKQAPTNAQIGNAMLRSYIATTSPDGLKVKNGARLEDGTRTYVAEVRDPTPNRIFDKNGKLDFGWLVVDGARLALDKLEGRVAPPTTKEIEKHISRDTLESFAKQGVPHRELDALSNKLADAAARAGVSAPDKLDAVHLRQAAMDLKADPATVVRHKGVDLCTVGELRQELAKVNALESQAREQLRGVLPEKGFDAAVKQLDLRTVQDIAKNGVDRNLVTVLKVQMQEKSSNNPGWFKTTDALNAISAARSGLSGTNLISTSATAQGKRHEGSAVMVSVEDLRSEVATAVRTLGREKDWDVVALEYGETPKFSGNGPANEGPEKPALVDGRAQESQARTEPTLDNSQRDVGKLEMAGRTEPTLGNSNDNRTNATGREEASSDGKNMTAERADPQRTETQEKIQAEDQRQATFAREMTR